jgi:hypothetical protein
LPLENVKLDSLYLVNNISEVLFKNYDINYAKYYYSGVDSTFYMSSDDWGNFKMKGEIDAHRGNPVIVYDENSNYRTLYQIPESMEIQTILLLFDKQAMNSNSRKIYPGIHFPLVTSSGLELEIDDFLSYNSIK